MRVRVYIERGLIYTGVSLSYARREMRVIYDCLTLRFGFCWRYDMDIDRGRNVFLILSLYMDTGKGQNES